MEKDIILIDKPKGITSFDVIRQLRKKLGIRKMGHAGTLDPLASGLLIIGVESGTKKLADFLKLDKVYEAEILVGQRTASGDLEGEVLEECTVDELDKKQVKSVLANLTGQLFLSVPIFSAIKQNGEALYKKARRGEEVKPPKKEMYVYDIKLKSIHPEGKHYVLAIETKVASGTYIRSLAEEIGRRLGYPATVKELRRTQIGEYSISQAVSL